MLKERAVYSQKHKRCKYPNCEECVFKDCIMNHNDIVLIVKRRKEPDCDVCEHCTAFIDINGDDDIRCCLRHKRLIGNEVETSPEWCEKRY